MSFSSILTVTFIIIILIVVIYFIYNQSETTTRQLVDQPKKKVRFDVPSPPVLLNSEMSDFDISSFMTSEMPDAWDREFGKPLISSREKDKYIKKIKTNHDDYEKSFGEFLNHQIDSDAVFKDDTIVNPFGPNRGLLKGKPISEIYDQQIARPKKLNHGCA